MCPLHRHKGLAVSYCHSAGVKKQGTVEKELSRENRGLGDLGLLIGSRWSG